MPSDSNWALVRGAHTTWRRFRDTAGALPRAAWLRWLGTLALGFGLTVAVVFGTVWVGQQWAEAWMAAWDEATLRRLVAVESLSFNTGIWFESPGNSVVLAPLLLAGFVLAARAGRPLLALSFPLTYAGSKLLTHVGWAAWARARPGFVADGVASLGAHSYPSGHVINVLAAYGLLTYLWIERSESPAERTVAVLVLLALASVVGVARLRLGAHWPSDVVAGGVIGAVWLVTLVVALRRGEAAGDDVATASAEGDG
jgi:undecaprenyl-diphosphatase